MAKSIVIAERDNIAAVFEDNKCTEFFIHRGDILLGDVYMSKVENILPSIEAAFVNVGSDKMGFLHAADVIGKGGLQDKLSPKQKIDGSGCKRTHRTQRPARNNLNKLPRALSVCLCRRKPASVSAKRSFHTQRKSKAKIDCEPFEAGRAGYYYPHRGRRAVRSRNSGGFGNSA